MILRRAKNYIIHRFKPLSKKDVEDNTKNIEFELQRRALRTTADFVLEHLSKTSCYNHDLELLKQSIKSVEIDGLFLEFGVYKGRSIKYISKLIPKSRIYGFDSFRGLPETWRGRITKGAFKIKKKPRVPSNVSLIEGWFDETLPEFVKQHQLPAAFIHIDSDLYSSAKTIFDCLKDNIVSGTVIVFDEFFNYPDWENGEYRAFMEFIEKTKLDFSYLGYCYNDEQVSVKIG